MNQREKDENYAKGHYNGPCTSSDLYLCQGFADGAEYGRRDLAKLERLLREGWDCGFSRHCGFEIWNNRAELILVRGATLAEALAQVEEAP